MKIGSPRISVVMPVHNGMPFLPEAVESILRQSYHNFELIIVNDCSSDGTKPYLDSLADPRVIRIHLHENKGVTGALQAGLAAVRGELIARLDADDVAYPNRLDEQVKFMDLNPNMGLLASYAHVIDEDGHPVKGAMQKLKSEIDLRWELLFKNPIVHSTVMFRRDILTRHGLSYALKYAEDYDLWVRMAEVSHLTCLPLPLIRYRANSNSWTFSKATEQSASAIEVSARAIRGLVEMPDDSIVRIRHWVRHGGGLSAKDVGYFNDLVNAFLSKYDSVRTRDFEKRLLHFMRKRFGLRAYCYRLWWNLALAWRP